jgi:transcriptional regulator with XRE-family HTH domain
LSPLARFLTAWTHKIGLTQAELAKALGASTSTVSRWSRDEADIAEEEFELLSNALRVPTQTLHALVLFEDRQDQPFEAFTWATELLAAGSEKLLVAGFTGASAAHAMRYMDLSKKTVLFSTIDPKARLEQRFKDNALERGVHLSSWLATLHSLRLAVHEGARCRWVVRTSAMLDAERKLGQVVANDFVAILSPSPPWHDKPMQLAFAGDGLWQRAIEPLVESITNKDKMVPGHRLLWDTSDPETEAVVKETAEHAIKVVAELSLGDLSSIQNKTNWQASLDGSERSFSEHSCGARGRVTYLGAQAMPGWNWSVDALDRSGSFRPIAEGRADDRLSAQNRADAAHLSDHWKVDVLRHLDWNDVCDRLAQQLIEADRSNRVGDVLIEVVSEGELNSFGLVGVSLIRSYFHARFNHWKSTGMRSDQLAMHLATFVLGSN